MALSGQALGRCSMTRVLSATTRVASFSNRSRSVSNCATRKIERFQAAQRPQQPVGARMQHLAELVGGGAAAGCAISGEMTLPRLDMVFGLTAPAVDVLVDPARGAVRQLGDDEARVGTLRPGLNAGDDALDARPARGAIMEFLVAPEFLGTRCTSVPAGGTGFQRLDMPAQRRGAGDAKHEVAPRRAAELQHFRRAIVAVRADQDLDARPVAAELLHQAAQEGARLGAGGAPGRAQQGGNGAAVCVEDNDRLEAIRVVVGVEEAELLPAMDGVEGVVDVKRDAARHLAEARAVERHHGAGHVEQLTPPRGVLQARQRRLRAERGSVGQAPAGQLEQRIMPQAAGIVAVLVAGGHHQ